MQDRPSGAPRGDAGLTSRARMSRRGLLVAGAAATGALASGGVLPAMAGHEPRLPTPDRPPPSSELLTYEEAVLAFRNHGMHLEMLAEPITPLGSHFQLIHFDIPRL